MTVDSTIALDPALEVHPIPTVEIFNDENFNCRGYIAPSEVIDLTRDIGQHGLQQPITIQPWVMHPPHKYRIIQGHRRFTAMSLGLKWDIIPCMIRSGLTEREALILNFGENLQREPLNIIQEAKAVKRLLDAGLNQLDIAKELRMQRPWVQVRAYVLDFPEDIQHEISLGTLTQPQIHEIHQLDPSKWYEAVRTIKEAKDRAGKKRLNVSVKKLREPRPESLVKAKPRKADEALIMLEHMVDADCIGLHTRVLAWMIGEISTMDLLQDFKAECDLFEKPYRIPTEGIGGL